jgi:hypothetical protein
MILSPLPCLVYGEFKVSFDGCSVEIKDSCQISDHAYNEEESLIMLLPHYDLIAMLLLCTYYKAFVLC